jgi:hypothetical protein
MSAGRVCKVALLSSTRAVLAPMEAAFAAVFPEAKTMHLLDEALLEDFVAAGGLSPGSRYRALQMAMRAQEGGADGILVTCSTMSPCVDDFRQYLRVPAVKIDEPAIELALAAGDRLGLLTTADSVLRSVEPLVRAKAAALGKEVVIERLVRGDLWPLAARDREAFHRGVGQAATAAARELPAVLITQVSMSPGWEYVDPSVRDRVFATPLPAVRALRRGLEGGNCDEH